MSTKSVQRSIANDMQLDTVLESSESIFAAALSHDIFSEFDVELVDDRVISIAKNESEIFLATPSLPTESQYFNTLKKKALSEHISLVFIGTKSELRSVTLDEESMHIQRLACPLTIEGLYHQLETSIKFQSTIDKLSKEKTTIQNDSEDVKYILSISRELNGIRDVNKLLALILKKAREITQADAGSIYIVQKEDDTEFLHFKITQNESIPVNLEEFKMPINARSIVGACVIERSPINIPDLYKLSSDSTKNPFGLTYDKKIDEQNRYQCRSMLTLPIFNISHQVIGVIQLINAKKDGTTMLKSDQDFESQIIPFEDSHLDMALIVAQQAGIALENAILTEEKENLFEGFVNASVKAIEQRDPTTSGHSHRVARLTLDLAHIVDDLDVGPYKDVRFTSDQFKEIEYASLLHDFGKLGVRENVLIKAKKLYPLQFDLLKQRFELIRAMIENNYLQQQLKYKEAAYLFPPGMDPESFAFERNKKIEELDSFLKFIDNANKPTVLEQGGFEKLKDIANLSFHTPSGNVSTYITQDELKALSVARGSLTAEEFEEIQSHVTHTYNFLRTIPWGTNLSMVPEIAAKHHEKLDGSGYPSFCKESSIPLQTRMMTISDIFDALTASDRPYKKAVPVEKALDILNMEVKAGKIDLQLFNLFVETKSYQPVIDSANANAN